MKMKTNNRFRGMVSGRAARRRYEGHLYTRIQGANIRMLSPVEMLEFQRGIQKIVDGRK